MKLEIRKIDGYEARVWEDVKEMPGVCGVLSGIWDDASAVSCKAGSRGC